PMRACNWLSVLFFAAQGYQDSPRRRDLARRSWRRSRRTLLQETADKLHHVGLQIKVATTVKELCDSARPEGFGIQEVRAQVFKRLQRRGIREQGTVLSGHLGHAGAEVAEQVKQVIGVLVLAPDMESQGL